RKSVGDQRRRVGEKQRTADSLDDPPEDQLGAVRGEPGTERGGGEEEEAADVGLLAAEEVREAPRGQHKHGRGDHVGEDHPDQLEQGRAEGALEVRQGDDQGAGVDRREQHPEARAAERPPLVVLVPGRYARAEASPAGAVGNSYVHVRISIAWGGEAPSSY